MFDDGQKFAHYKVISAIGEGGMGKVYLAEDTKLGRRIALKVLSPGSTQDPDRVNRFIQEARAASALNHPNIITIHEIGECDGIRYIATELIEGETLRERLARNSLGVNEILNISVQIAEALAAAHAAGIVHRDIKPENIMLRSDGYLKILDFGLAKLSEQSTFASGSQPQALVQTQPGLIMGTVSYMSPEQVRALEIDARTDIWSFGIVLYAMLEGLLPFTTETPNDYIAGILRSEPSPLKRLGIPDDLKRLVQTTLKKNRDERYQMMSSVLSELKEIREELSFSEKLERSASPHEVPITGNETTVMTDSARTGLTIVENTSPGGGPGKTRGRLVIFAFLAALAAGLGIIGYFAFFERSSINSVAVLPFENGSGDPNLDYLSDGLSESVIDKLSQLPQLKVIARSSSFKYRGQNLDLQQIAAVLGVQAIVTGRVVQRGDDLSIRVEMMDAQENKQLWGEQYSRRASDAVNMQQEIAQTVSEKLKLRLSAPQTQLITKRDTTDPQAYELLLKGKFFDDKGGTENRKKAQEFYEKAVAADPNYALAYASLSAIYRRLAADSSVDPKEFIPKAEAAARKALELDETLADAHLTMGNLHQYAWRWTEAEAEYKRGIELNPNLGVAHRAYSQFLSLIGRHDEAIAEAKRARELDPVVLSANASVGYRLCFARRFDEAIAELNRLLQMDPNYDLTYVTLGYSYAGKKMYREAVNAYQEAIRLGDESPSTQIYLGAAYALAGDKAKAEEILKQLLNGSEYVSPGELSVLYGALGDKESAFASLDKAYAIRDLQLQFLKSDPAFDPLRDDPRFKDLMKKVGFPE